MHLILYSWHFHKSVKKIKRRRRAKGEISTGRGRCMCVWWLATDRLFDWMIDSFQCTVEEPGELERERGSWRNRMGAILIDRWVILWSGREREKKKSLIIYRLHQVGLNGRRRCCSGCCIVSAVANDGGINDSYTNERAHSTWRRPLRTRPVLEPATSESRTDS